MDRETDRQTDRQTDTNRNGEDRQIIMTDRKRRSVGLTERQRLRQCSVSVLHNSTLSFNENHDICLVAAS